MKKVWGIKNCNSVKKALDVLDSRGITYVFVDLKKSPPTREKLQEWVDKKGIETVLNSKGTTYRKLGIKDRNLSEIEKIDLMAEHPSLIKRPVLEEEEDLLEFGLCGGLYEKIR